MHAYVNVAQVWGLALVTAAVVAIGYTIVKEAKATHQEIWWVASDAFKRVFH